MDGKQALIVSFMKPVFRGLTSNNSMALQMVGVSNRARAASAARRGGRDEMQVGEQLVDRHEVVGERGVVAAKNRLASEAGARMFALGGNAMDAAIAAAFASGVVEPMMSGLGGGGVMIVHDPADGQSFCVEFGHRAPALAVPGCFELGEGRSSEVFNLVLGEPRLFLVNGYVAVSKPPKPTADQARERD